VDAVPIQSEAGAWACAVPAEEGKVWYYRIAPISLSGREGAPSAVVSGAAASGDAPAVVILNFGGSDAVTPGGTLIEEGIPAVRVTAVNSVQMPYNSSYDVDEAMTVQFWVKLLEPGAIPVLVCHGLWQQDGFFVQYLGGKIRFSLADVGTLDAGSLEMGKWTHVAATYDGSEMVVYINGERAGSKPAAGRVQYAARPLYIGRYEAGGKEFQVDGFIGGFRLYAYARMAEQIKADYNSRK
jgi:hypothetical protein